MESLEGYKSINNLLKELKRPFNEEEIVYIIHKLVDALENLKKFSIVNYNITCDNIFLNTKNGDVKLDAGSSKFINSQQQYTSDTQLLNQNIKSILGYLLVEISGGLQNKSNIPYEIQNFIQYCFLFSSSELSRINICKEVSFKI
ncbi:hypothetical protein DICPUDRAFT_150426 [Dictyostelium purpureum]|uniref:Protein kinase domain-containing protein n=1 Tax=Dictyostelium purpureum TaxID=5786 RepID=F0ZGB0_DICPU|nr:uncharacterized protein DICPUDRAFT_150426 [Dictyostelium purpureum]EGC37031.1 hypothetical protein DICPUDRAFT_150426 [Dictyostelium purpureum]|eukprot:XP_003286459.1 hypothetical protein DICPUDRAFT_150426 [Dictyostelium purpureum]